MKVGFKGAKLYRHVFVMISFHLVIYPPGEGNVKSYLFIYLCIYLFIYLFLKNKKKIFFKCCPFYFIVE